jgi:hypothetical protein
VATGKDFVEYVLSQTAGGAEVSYRKMFGEYMVYCDGKPAFLVCDGTVFVKRLDEVAELFALHGVEPETGEPYAGAKPHYILDIDDRELASGMAALLAKILPPPKPKAKKAGTSAGN